ncbi:DUF6415 family natural product biosynthesis protein [Streptomyces sp. B1866]|uniref:DUF6415 family natural product biosynthesis protein n=1 Tax=Streptomyces sp. B1866 TaxID=3075431 RepID=UPI002890405C|nr:DUF6415 family natural product biosynthesis protein [Streptomyces sp. B1866]MDT3397933.1 DUF6415 family natural product biosynthesis protein [Streptomyces sp. B1866]
MSLAPAAAALFDLDALDRAANDALDLIGDVGDEEVPPLEDLLDRRGVLRTYTVLLLPLGQARCLQLGFNTPERVALTRALQHAEYALCLPIASNFDVTVIDTRALARAVRIIRAHIAAAEESEW